MKRYKQLILSNFFVTIDGFNNHHLVEANLDIESRDDRTLCTEILHGNYSYKVLTNDLVPTICPICTAILIRRINNMPQETKVLSVKNTDENCSIPATQLTLSLPEISSEKEKAEIKRFEQFELVI